MARYFFDLVDGQLETDREGTELSSDTEAQVAATTMFGFGSRLNPRAIPSSAGTNNIVRIALRQNNNVPSAEAVI